MVFIDPGQLHWETQQNKSHFLCYFLASTAVRVGKKTKLMGFENWKMNFQNRKLLILP